MLIVEVTWWEPTPLPSGDVSCQLIFSGGDPVQVTVHETASVAPSQWDELRRRVLVATTEAELAVIYKGSQLGASFARGEMLQNRNAFIALHAFGPEFSQASLVENLIPDMLAEQYGHRIVGDMRNPPHSLFVLPTPTMEDEKALRELYRIGRLHRLTFRRVAMPPARGTSSWSTFFVPFRSPSFSQSSVSADAWDLSARIHAAYTNIGGI